LAQGENRPETAYLRSQLAKLVMGLVLLAFFARFPVRRFYGPLAWWVLGGSALLLLLLLLPVGLAVTVRGTRRFLNFRVIQLQPAEFARLGLVIFLAYYASRKEEWIRESWRSLIVPLTVLGLLAGLVVLQPNLSSAVLMAGLGFVLLLLGGQPWKRLACVAVPPVIGVMATMKKYQWERVAGFWQALTGGHEALPYQVKQSLIALGSGGFRGTGIGQGPTPTPSSASSARKRVSSASWLCSRSMESFWSEGFASRGRLRTGFRNWSAWGLPSAWR
jgi:cell division protein FtsW